MAPVVEAEIQPQRGSVRCHQVRAPAVAVQARQEVVRELDVAEVDAGMEDLDRDRSAATTLSGAALPRPTQRRPRAEELRDVVAAVVADRERTSAGTQHAQRFIDRWKRRVVGADAGGEDDVDRPVTRGSEVGLPSTIRMSAGALGDAPRASARRSGSVSMPYSVRCAGPGASGSARSGANVGDPLAAER